jgi:hypothetical protein
MPAARHPRFQRRTTAAALKQQILAYLGDALPEGWLSQPLEPGEANAADILVISPRGRCHFLFVRAPADRWWDGGPRSVPAERFAAEAMCLAQRLRAAGHRARAVWGAPDLTRALRAWGCVPIRPARFGPRGPERPPSTAKPTRPVLHLSGWGRRADA